MRRGALRMERKPGHGYWLGFCSATLILPLFDYTKIRVIVLQLVRALQSPGGLVRHSHWRPTPGSFVFHRSGAGGWEAEEEVREGFSS